MDKKSDADKKKSGGRGQRTALIILCCVLAVILVVLVAATAFVEQKLGLINKPEEQETLSSSELQEFLDNQTEMADPDYTGETVHPDDITWNPGNGLLENSDQVINIMLIGQDRRPGEGRARSDAMILCTINKIQKTITMTSFMRDMYVQIPGYRDNRINVCYFLEGMDLLDACIEKNFGIHIDGNVEVDFNSFSDVIDSVGGVEIEITSGEANIINTPDEVSDRGFSLSAGRQTLNGLQALRYSRIRKLDNDFGRTERQRNVLTALAEKAKSLSVSQLNNMLDTILPLITTDMSHSQIIGYALDLFPVLSNLKVDTLRIPADGTYQNTMISGMSVLLPDLEANREVLLDKLSH